MQRTVRAYEKPSRISQGLVVCLSIAVVLAAGRLVSTIILSRYATASAVKDTGTTSAPLFFDQILGTVPTCSLGLLGPLKARHDFLILTPLAHMLFFAPF